MKKTLSVAELVLTKHQKKFLGSTFTFKLKRSKKIQNFSHFLVRIYCFWGKNREIPKKKKFKKKKVFFLSL
jgi:hypothetical protein